MKLLELGERRIRSHVERVVLGDAVGLVAVLHLVSLPGTIHGDKERVPLENLRRGGVARQVRIRERQRRGKGEKEGRDCEPHSWVSPRSSSNHARRLSDLRKVLRASVGGSKGRF